ncbi:MAG TPA: YcxB family protein [Acidobacteriaceae bacterium]|nr:YcxB family protein [Acidobacteriaceae bacterium]
MSDQKITGGEASDKLNTASALLSIGILVISAWAIAVGIAPHRWRLVVAFVLLWTLAALYVAVARRVLKRRAENQLSIPIGARLPKQIWMALVPFFSLISFGAAFGALSAGAGLPKVAIAILACSVALSSTILRADLTIGVTCLVFEPAGLRVQLKGGHFFIPWSDITDIERSGAHVIFLHLRDTRSVIATLKPDTAQIRARVRNFVLGPRGQLLIGPWMGGFPSLSLERAIRRSIGRPGDGAN